MEVTATETTEKKNGFFDISGAIWYEKILIFLPFVLITIGGAIGGGVGCIGVFANKKIWDSSLSKGVKFLRMIGVLILCVVGWLVAGVLLTLVL